MFKGRDVVDYLADIAVAIDEVNEFTLGMSFETFSNDKKTVNAVIRSLEVVGEASKHIPIDFRDEHPEIPWKQMAGMRDVLIHDYMGVDLMTVWKVVRERLQELKPMIAALHQ
ncbi:MAG: DUF86 domain-containing protein [Desulfuromonadales bacterium]|nr:DUF86 domain-containing protein [Desulfuromonadales bacterium]MDT8422407.1 DUF86 domain-containing protein [Desulfuromonadales bacterium]